MASTDEIHALLPDFKPLFIIWPEELKGFVDLHTFTSVLANVKLCGKNQDQYEDQQSIPHISWPAFKQLSFYMRITLHVLCTFCRNINPVEVACQFLGDVGLSSGW